MGQRSDLHAKLKDICENVYFQPPESVKMNYPAIVYRLANIKTAYGDNLPYMLDHSYALTYITRDPDDPVRDILAALPMCSFSRHYTADGLNHYSYTIYY